MVTTLEPAKLEYINAPGNDLKDIVDKVLEGERLTEEDGVKLYHSNDLLTIGILADFVRKKKNGDNVYWINNYHINPTNICVGTCNFCAFKKDEGEKGAYILSPEKIAERVQKRVGTEVRELHMVSGLYREANLDYFKQVFQNIHAVRPDIHIKALTAVEIDYIANLAGKSIEETLRELNDAGLGSLPGGGAEIFAKDVRDETCPEKIGAEQWAYIHKTAHKIGFRTNCTMLTGIGEEYEHRVDHMIKLRDIQDETNGFMTFIGLNCYYTNTTIQPASNTTGYDNLKDLAIGRLLLDNIQHIKAYWIHLGTKLAQISLSFGVDDLDGTVVEEKIAHDAGTPHPQGVTKSQLVNMIKKAGRIPLERDTLYNIVKVYG